MIQQLGDRLRNLEELERLKHFELETTKRKEFEGRKGQLALARGQFPDTTIVWQILEAWQEHRGMIVDGWIHIRHTLALLEPALATAEQLATLESMIESYLTVDLDQLPARVREFSEGYECPEAALNAMVEHANLQAYGLLVRMREKLAQLKIEFRRRGHPRSGDQMAGDS